MGMTICIVQNLINYSMQKRIVQKPTDTQTSDGLTDGHTVSELEAYAGNKC